MLIFHLCISIFYYLVRLLSVSSNWVWVYICVCVCVFTLRSLPLRIHNSKFIICLRHGFAHVNVLRITIPFFGIFSISHFHNTQSIHTFQSFCPINACNSYPFEWMASWKWFACERNVTKFMSVSGLYIHTYTPRATERDMWGKWDHETETTHMWPNVKFSFLVWMKFSKNSFVWLVRVLIVLSSHVESFLINFWVVFVVIQLNEYWRILDMQKNGDEFFW